MTTHLSPDELVDALSGGGAPSARAHLDDCAACRRELARLQSLVGEVARVNVPEPSPLFWDHFSTRVHDTLDAEPVPNDVWWPRWLRPQVLLPLSAMALIVFALSSVVRAPLVPPLPTSDGIEINDLSSLGQDDWSVVLNIVGDLDVEQAAAAGIEIRPGDIESAVEQLTVAEQRELLRILQEEIGKSGD